jgi:tripartite ATP-independent transporter DctM subunit
LKEPNTARLDNLVPLALAQVNIMTSIIFGGISGAAVADTVALGSIFIPAMEKEGYDRAFSTAVTLASSIISPIIPPSIILIIYGAISGESIAGLFAAGLVPGIAMGIALMLWTHVIAKKRNYVNHAGSFSVKKLYVATKRAIFALLMPVIIVGGILGGVVTPTEAAALAAGYALFVGGVIYRTLSWKDLYQIFFNASLLMGIISLIVASAAIVGWFLASERIPEAVAQLFLSLSSNKYMVLFLINIMMIIIGMFLDINAALIILTPILAPIALNIGVHPFKFGVIMCINLAIALLTPPMGGGLFVAMSIGKVELVPLLKQIWPYILVEYAVLFLVTYIPPLTMAVPTLLGFVK